MPAWLSLLHNATLASLSGAMACQVQSVRALLQWYGMR